MPIYCNYAYTAVWKWIWNLSQSRDLLSWISFMPREVHGILPLNSTWQYRILNSYTASRMISYIFDKLTHHGRIEMISCRRKRTFLYPQEKYITDRTTQACECLCPLSLSIFTISEIFPFSRVFESIKLEKKPPDIYSWKRFLRYERKLMHNREICFTLSYTENSIFSFVIVLWRWKQSTLILKKKLFLEKCPYKVSIISY